MRKRFISGLTAVCIVGVLITNMITSASAVISAAVIGASVAGSLLLGTLFNQMCGGQGYDFTNAFQDAVKLYTDWEEDFDGSAKDPIHPVTKVEIDTSKVNIPDNVNFNSVGGTSADKMIIEMQKAINEGLEDGSIEINFDEDGNLSMPTTSWCNAVCETYEKFGIYKNKNGLNYVQTYFSIVSEYIESTWRGWDQTVCKQSLRPHTSFKPRFVPYFVQNDKLTFLNLQYVVGDHSVMLQYLSWGSGKIDSGVSSPALKTDDELYSQKDGAYVEGLSCTQSFSLSSDLSLASMSAVNAVDSVSYDYDLSKNRSFRVGLGGSEFDPSSPVQECGYVLLKDGADAFSGFKISATEGAIENKRNDVSIPLTGVENTIGNMGLAGVGTGTAKGTVSVNSKTKDITVTNDATKEAELVIEQGKAGDIDLPDNDTIIDKFPFSLPFDLYRILTIFVVPEQKPIFTFPIETTITNGGLNYKIDEEIKVDLTRFQFMGQDIVRLVLRSTFYVGFVIMLIHVTSKFIKH